VIISSGGAGGGTIYGKAVDPAGNEPGGDSNFPTPSGVYKMELKNLGSGAAIAPAPAIAAIGENPATRTFSNLAEGQYQLTVFDGTGNATSVSFAGETPAPKITGCRRPSWVGETSEALSRRGHLADAELAEWTRARR
jgi:hypothetical protein